MLPEWSAYILSRAERKPVGRLIEGYGLTETSPVTHSKLVCETRKAGSIGVPVPSTDAKVVYDKDREMPVGKILRRVLSEEERAKFS